jgi:dTDP-glucose 4,6-dehydratase
MKKYLVTGGAGFIGSNFINILYKKLLAMSEPFEIHCIDKLTYAGDVKFIDDEVRNSGSFFLHQVDIVSSNVFEIFRENIFAFGVHFAAESHVDRSIEGPAVFIETNVLGTANLLEAWRETQSSRFVAVGTDEVYGSMSVGFATEDTHLNPTSPYSASKTSADLIALSYRKTYLMDVVITRCTNNYGPNQNPEKFIPKMIQSLKENEELPVYGDGKNSREWIHVSDHVEAILMLLEANQLKHYIYNIGSGHELSNLELIEALRKIAAESKSEIKFVQDRPAHDFRYALDSRRIKEEFGWKPRVSFEQGLAELYRL